jgi:hypothetical protein
MRALAFAKLSATAKAIPATCTCLCKAPAQGTGDMHEARLNVHSMLFPNASARNQHSYAVSIAARIYIQLVYTSSNVCVLRCVPKDNVHDLAFG